MDQTSLADEKPRLRAFEASLLNGREAVADQSSYAANARWFLDFPWQKSTKHFYALV